METFEGKGEKKISYDDKYVKTKIFNNWALKVNMMLRKYLQVGTIKLLYIHTRFSLKVHMLMILSQNRSSTELSVPNSFYFINRG